MRQRASPWLSRRDEVTSTSNDALASCAAIAVQRGTTRALRRAPEDAAAPEPPVERPPPTEDSVDHDGFDLNASVRHWDRLLHGLLYAASARVDWATLLRRTLDADVLQCAACGGRLRVLGEIT